ncbi:MAG: hypothetical protein OXI70_12240 [Chloroflexota bacterium]|nr:hypothetical protein [Chloroflexota bacterium]
MELLIVLAPIVVFAAGIIFRRIPLYSGDLLPDGQSLEAHHDIAYEIKYRYWTITSFLVLLTACIVAVVATILSMKRAKCSCTKWVSWLAGAVAIVLVSRVGDELPVNVLHTVSHLLPSDSTIVSRIGIGTTVTTVFTSFASLGIFVATTTLVPPRIKGGRLEDRMTRSTSNFQTLGGLVLAASFVLASGVMLLNAWLKWLGGFVKDRDSDYLSLVSGLVNHHAIAFVLTLIAGFLPIWIWMGASNRSMIGEYGGDGSEIWFQRNRNTYTKWYLLLFPIVSPLLASIIQATL